MGLMFVTTRSTNRPGRGALCLAILTLFFATFFTACESTPKGRPVSEQNMVPTVLLISAGDILDITFSGATNFNGARRVGPEGSIAMPIIGQIQASGKTVSEVESELEKAYSKELQDSDVVVNLAGSSTVVYVSGSVMRPGRVVLDRPLTALEAILEAGGFAPDANLKRVSVIRYEGTDNTTFDLNLEPVYTGGPVPPFYLKPRDVVNVARKIQWF